MRALLVGIQGSGKSTIGKYIAAKFGVTFVSTGDIFRELREEDSVTGRLVKSLVDQGKFVPDELTMKIVNQRLREGDAANGFVLDGAPRNLAQEKLLEQKIDLVVIVNLNEEVAIKRLISRGRHDDSEQAIKNRIEWHKENTVPLIDYYKSKGVRTIEVDNTSGEEEVRKNLDELFKN